MASTVLLRFLRWARRRQMFAAFVSAWVATLSTLLVVSALILVAGRFWGGPLEQAIQPQRLGVVLAQLVALSTVLAATLTLVRTPSLGSVAGLVDSTLGLGGLAATATERVYDQTSDSLPVRAMFEEIDERLTRSKPADVVALRARRWFAVLPVACGVLALAAVAPIERQVPSTITADLGTITPGSVIGNLDRLADLLESRGASEEPALAAYSPALRELGEYVATSGVVDLAAAERLSELLASIARAAVASDTATAQAVAAAFEGTSFDPLASSQTDRPFRFGSDEAANTRTSESAAEGEEAITSSSEFDPASVFRTLGEVASSVERSVGDVAARTNRESSDGSSQDGEARSGGYYTDWNEEMADAQAAKRAEIRQRGRGEAVAGEANRSDDSPGDAAGRGSQPLDSGRAEQDAGLLELTAQDFIVDADLREGGNTNSYLPEPEVGARSVVEMSQHLRDSLESGIEMPVTIEAVATRNRDVVALYFGRRSDGGLQVRLP